MTPRPLVGLLLLGVALQLDAQSAPAGGVSRAGDARLRTADSLFARGDLLGAYREVERHLPGMAGDRGARWHATRSALGLAMIDSTPEGRLAWSRAADGHGRALLALASATVDDRAWAAAARGRRALSESDPRTIARLARETLQLTSAVLAVDPRQPIANEVKGKLHAEVAGLPAIARVFAALYLGRSALREAGSWQLAERHLRLAIAMDPGLVVAYLDLGDVHLRQRRWSDASRTFACGIRVADRYPVDARFKAVMRERLAAIASATVAADGASSFVEPSTPSAAAPGCDVFAPDAAR